jgi:O-antigen ligase/tetratricopeptide (TPR) repeat protein
MVGHFANSLNMADALVGMLGLPLVLILPVLAALFSFVKSAEQKIAVRPVFGLREGAVLLVLWAGISLLRSESRFAGISTLLALLASLFLASLLARFGRDPKAWRALQAVVLGTGALVSVYGLVEYFGKGVTEYRIFSTFTNPDFLAGYLLLIIPFALASFVAAQDRISQAGYGATLAFGTVALFLTGSRAGIGALAGGVVAFVLLLLWARRLRSAKKSLLVGISILLVCGVLGFAPLRNRVVGQTAKPGQQAQSTTQAVQATAQAQGHSAAFRRWTWQGTLAMIRSNAVFGTGLGTYELTYPRYAQTAFTAHAHNGYLQWTAETGGVGAVLLLFVFASLSAFVLYVLKIGREEQEKEFHFHTFQVFQEPRVLMAGLLASLIASLLHSFLDSDWYIVGIMVTLAAVLALLLALARGVAPLAAGEARKFGAVEYGALGVAGLVLAWYGSSLLRNHIATTGILGATDIASARSSFQSATSALPSDFDSYLNLAMLEQRAGNVPEAESLLVKATQIAPCGKTFYRLAQFYVRTNRPEKAIEPFQSAREREPRNVQNLRALGDTYRKLKRTDEARQTYEVITELERGVYGKVRAMPEVIEAEFGYAHLALGEIAFEQKNWAEAAKAYEAAGRVFGEYWEHRDWEAYIPIPPQKRADWQKQYQYLLEQWVKSLKESKADTKEVEARLAKFTQEAATMPPLEGTQP